MCILTIFAQIWSKCHGIIPIFLYFGVLYFLPVTLPFFNIFWGLQTWLMCGGQGQLMEVSSLLGWYGSQGLNSSLILPLLSGFKLLLWAANYFSCDLRSLVCILISHLEKEVTFVSILLDRIYSKFGLQGNFPGRPGKAVFLGRPLSFLYVELPPPLNKALR